MPTITLTNPVAGTGVVAGLMATNFTNLQTLLNGALDNANIAANAGISVSKLAIAGTPDGTKFLRDDATWQVISPGSLTTTAAFAALTPTDGQEVFLLVDATLGIIWHLRYRAASASTYKWEFLGGTEMSSEIATSQTTTSATYVALTTAGPSITLPFGGDYEVWIGALITSSGSGNGWMSYDIGATGAVDADAIEVGTGAASTGIASASRWQRKNGLTAITLTSKYKTPNGSLATFVNRWMRVRPVRIGQT